MRKITAVALVAMLSVGMVTGCANSKSAAEATTEAAAETTTVDYGKGLNSDGTIADITATDYVTVCDYAKIKLAKDDITASDDDVQGQIDSLMSSYTQTEQITDRKVKDGDTVNIDYTGTIDGQEFDGGSATGYDLSIGSGTFIDDFEDQLVGHKPGDTVKVEVTFPDDYSTADLAGKDAVFETKINYISEQKEQELTDKFVKENLKDSYGYTSVKDMKKKIKKSLEETNKVDAVWDYMLEKSTFKEIPESVVNNQIDVIVDGLKQQCESYGYSFEDYLSSYNIEDEKALRDQYYSSCENAVKVYLVADAIAKEKKITISDADISDYFNGEDYSTYEDTYGTAYLKRVVLNDKIAKEIGSTAVVK